MDNVPAVSTSGQPHHSAELRIVLIGGRQIYGSLSHKSATGNVILGKSVFETDRRTAQSVVGQQEVHGRKVTVVDTPGWWWHYPLENTPKLDQIEITNSVHLCAPGPHAFLLVIPVDLFFHKIFKHSLEEHLKLFQEGVSKHTIVLFTAQDPYHNENVKQIIDGPELQWILKQCGNRKHILNISDTDSTQVMKLFEKIEAMVAENAGGYCSSDRAAGNAVRQEIQGMTERASKRSDQVQTQRRELRALIEGGKTPPAHLRLVMVGAQGSAKSSAGNCILGKKAFTVQIRLRTTKCCEMSHSTVAGRKLTVVDSPGWFYNHKLQDTRKRDKLEIENSMNLCPPGPHAVLLMVGLASAFNQSYQRSVQEHMSLFTDDIWKHTVVVFTRGEWLGGRTVEERIESEKGLQWLVEKCGNRYHVLSDSTGHSDETQVTELLEKIEEMWAGNEDPHYEVDVQRAEAIEAGKEAEDKMAQRIWQITQRQSRILKEVFKGETQPITDLRFVLVGKKESGKSMAGNTILLQELFDSRWMKKEFQHKKPTRTCVKHQRDVAGVNITVVETPGWLPDDTMTPDWLKDEVARGVSLCAPGPHVFLLVVPISKAFMEEDRKAVVELLKPFGEAVWRYCMVLFTWGDWLNDTTIEQHIAAEGKSLRWLVEKCQNRYHVVSFYWCFSGELFHKINGLNMRNKGRCFSAGQTDKDKQKKKLKLPWQIKQAELTEEEWSRREQELIDRVLKAVLQEPSESTQSPVKMAASMDGFCVPSMSEGAPSEYGNTFWTLRGRTMVSEWLNNRVTDSDITSGHGSISAAASYMGNLDEIPLTDENHQPTHCFPQEKDRVKFDVPLQMRVYMDTVATRRRYSL